MSGIQISSHLFLQDHCHNGMKCSDKRCSCAEMSKQLFDPHGGFCVEPASNLRAVWTTDNDQAVQEYYAEPQQGVVSTYFPDTICVQQREGINRGAPPPLMNATDMSVDRLRPKSVVYLGVSYLGTGPLKVFFLGFKEDLIYLFQNKFFV